MSALAQTMREVQDDCGRDAVALASTPFTPRGMGEALAMIAAVARGVEMLAEKLVA